MFISTNVDRLNKICDFLPKLLNCPQKLYTINAELSLLEPYEYNPLIDNLTQTLYQENFILTDFDWMSWQETANIFSNNLESIKTADLSILKKLLTTYIRGDRFSSGYLASMLDGGQIIAILQRLEMIKIEMIDNQPENQIKLVQGDITQLRVDAIVNAANCSLLGGGGVDGAIHRAAGSELLAECRKLRGCGTGEAKITKGYKLPAKWIIHTVGPIWEGGDKREEELLAKCYRNCLALTEINDIKTIAFPAISTGVYKFPLELAAEIAIKEVSFFWELNHHLEEITFVTFSDRAYNVYRQVLQKLNP
ncbi:O-acetyl-ADP-ribose deacetylase [Merismopedia glauca]|nr:O-acetyl-ADP-ribose deacetylase [Merismopedia glauca]